jgi:uncharacterized membrane protein
VRSIHTAVTTGSVAVVALILAAPLLASDGHPLVSMVLYRTFAPLCHQLPERSFSLSGFPLAVCARCLGLYGGFAAGMLVLIASSLGTARANTLLKVLAASWLPLIVDGFGGWFGFFENTPFTRFITGSIAGAGVAYFVAVVIARSSGYNEPDHKKRTLEDHPL